MERHGSSPLEGDAGLPADDVDRLVEALQAEGTPLSTAQIAAVQNIQYRGPLPPPEDLLQYNNVMPEAAERIIAMAEKSLDAKVYTSKKLAEAEAKGILAVARSAAASPFIMGLVLIVSTIKEWGVGALGGSIGLLITGAPRLIDSIRGNGEKPDGITAVNQRKSGPHARSKLHDSRARCVHWTARHILRGSPYFAFRLPEEVAPYCRLDKRPSL